MFANIWPIAGMDKHVGLEMAFGDKAFATIFTVKRPFLSLVIKVCLHGFEYEFLNSLSL